MRTRKILDLRPRERARVFHKFCRPPSSLASAYLAPGEPARGRDFPRSRARLPKPRLFYGNICAEPLAGMHTRLIPDIASPGERPVCFTRVAVTKFATLHPPGSGKPASARDFPRTVSASAKNASPGARAPRACGDAYAANRGAFAPELADFRPTAPERTLQAICAPAPSQRHCVRDDSRAA